MFYYNKNTIQGLTVDDGEKGDIFYTNRKSKFIEKAFREKKLYYKWFQDIST